MSAPRIFPGAHHPDVGLRLGPYRVLSVLGEGGMSRVYLAEHVKLGRKVAIKRLRPHVARQRAAVQRFFSETRTVASLRHPHIVEVTDLVEDAGEVYAVMELLEGHTVAEAIALEGQLSPRRALHIAYQTSQALEAAHAAGVIHLDVKPANLFLAAHHAHPDFVKLLDFGVAHLEGDASEAIAGGGAASENGKLGGLGENCTGDGVEAASARPAVRPGGTPAYLSPEQAAGERVEARSDLYSLGVTLFEMLSGRLPFQAGGRAGYLYQHRHTPAPHLAELEDLPAPVPAPCSDLVDRLLAKNPDDRPPSARALVAAIEQTAHALRLELRPGAAPRDLGPGAVSGGLDRTGRRWGRLGAIAVAGGVVLVALGLLWHSRRPSIGPTSPPSRGTEGSMSRRVTLTVRSVPAHAEVVRISPSRQVLGLTPLRLTVHRPRAPWLLQLSLPGHLSRRVSVTLDRDQVLVLDLRPAPLARRDRARGAAPPHTRQGGVPGQRAQALPARPVGRPLRRTRAARRRPLRRRPLRRRPPSPGAQSRDEIVDPFAP